MVAAIAVVILTVPELPSLAEARLNNSSMFSISSLAPVRGSCRLQPKVEHLINCLGLLFPALVLKPIKGISHRVHELTDHRNSGIDRKARSKDIEVVVFMDS
ncbi:MAG TPA: hypothetical protein VJX67_04410 [Blastocatellia bacterium]|nr:hypothetical protein [Blastocatellia bacterium]